MVKLLRAGELLINPAHVIYVQWQEKPERLLVWFTGRTAAHVVDGAEGAALRAMLESWAVPAVGLPQPEVGERPESA